MSKFATVHLSAKDVVRHELVSRIAALRRCPHRARGNDRTGLDIDVNIEAAGWSRMIRISKKLSMLPLARALRCRLHQQSPNPVFPADDRGPAS